MFCVRNGRHKRSWRCVPLVEIYVGLLAHQVRVPTTDTLDLRQSVHNLAFTVNIGVEKTEDVLWSDIQSNIHERSDGGAHLELLMSFGKDQRHLVNMRGSVGQGQSVRHPCVE